jgi:hypothetical protein
MAPLRHFVKKFILPEDVKRGKTPFTQDRKLNSQILAHGLCHKGSKTQRNHKEFLRETLCPGVLVAK